MLSVQIPNNYQPERQYILSILLKEFLGLDFVIQTTERHEIYISIDDERSLTIADGLFAIPKEQWLQTISMPKQPLKVWDISKTPIKAVTVEPYIPVIFGSDPAFSDFFSFSATKIYLGLDIFGSAFFMLTRYEEVVKPDQDQYECFPAVASLAYQEGFLDRPIVNEYLEILWWCLNYLSPRLERKHREFQVRLSHDVDDPFELTPFRMKRWLRRSVGDLIIRRDLPLAASLIINGCFAALGLPYRDRLNTFDWLMEQSEAIGVKSAFYFICGGYSLFEPNYHINSSVIRKLIEHILSRGHEVGLHPSYYTYLQPDKLKVEANTLRCMLIEEGVLQTTIGGRQHYLRWKAPDTWQHWEECDLAYDSSLGYNESVGFRCGICYEYPVFNVKTRQVLKLRERPLIIMECSMLSSISMGLSYDNAWLEIEKLLHYCQLFKGDFTLLWHNSELIKIQSQRLYVKTLIEAGKT
jgi:hypothetical protein